MVPNLPADQDPFKGVNNESKSTFESNHGRRDSH